MTSMRLASAGPLERGDVGQPLEGRGFGDGHRDLNTSGAPPLRSRAWTVRRMEVGEGGRLRELRLAALREAPGAFGSTAEREEAYEPRDWEMLARRPGRGVRRRRLGRAWPACTSTAQRAAAVGHVGRAVRRAGAGSGARSPRR